jgi:hypothetical protein
VDEQEERTADFFYVEPHYFDTLHIPMVRGRAITDLDTADTLHVALVNESLARRVWPGQDPIGQEVHMADQRRRQRESLVPRGRRRGRHARSWSGP